MEEDQKNQFNPKILGIRAKRLRIQNGLSIEQLASKAGVNKNTVVRIEQGYEAKPSTIYSICTALETTPFHLLESKLVDGVDYKHMMPETVNIIKKNKTIIIDNEDVIDEPLDRKLRGGQLNAYVFEFVTETRWRSHPGEEYLYCIEGEIQVEIAETNITLKKGESLYFWPQERHRYVNKNKSGASRGLSVWLDKETIATKDRYPIYKEKE